MQLPIQKITPQHKPLTVQYKACVFRKGQALIEIMIALGMALLVITGFMTATNAGLTSSTFATEKARSVTIAREGLEKIRWYRDEKGWGDCTNDNYLCKKLRNCTSSGCTDAVLFSGDTMFTNSPTAPFMRKYYISGNDPEFTVHVEVSWPNRNNSLSKTDLYTIFTDWRFP